MNTLVIPILLGLLPTPDTAYVQPSFVTGLYVVQSTGHLRLAVDNHWQRRLSVRLINATHEVVYEDVIARRNQSYRRLFNLDQLPKGMYQLQISDGHQTTTHTVVVGAPIPPPTRWVRVAEAEVTR